GNGSPTKTTLRHPVDRRVAGVGRLDAPSQLLDRVESRGWIAGVQMEDHPVEKLLLRGGLRRSRKSRSGQLLDRSGELRAVRRARDSDLDRLRRRPGPGDRKEEKKPDPAGHSRSHRTTRAAARSSDGGGIGTADADRGFEA